MARFLVLLAIGLIATGEAANKTCAHVFGLLALDPEVCTFGWDLNANAADLQCQDFTDKVCNNANCCTKNVAANDGVVVVADTTVPIADTPTATTTATAWDSSASDSSGSHLGSSVSGSSGSLKSSFSASLNTGSSASNSISGSSASSGSTQSGSSGFYLPIWQWFLLVLLCCCCCAGGAGASMGGGSKKKKKSSKKGTRQSAPAPVPTAPIDPVFEVAPLLPPQPLLPLAAPISMPYGQMPMTTGIAMPATMPTSSMGYASPASATFPANYTGSYGGSYPMAYAQQPAYANVAPGGVVYMGQ